MKTTPRITRSTIWAIFRSLALEKSIQVAFEQLVIVPHGPGLLLQLVGDDHRRSLIDCGLQTAIVVVLHFVRHARIVGERLYLLLLIRREGRGRSEERRVGKE